MNTRFLLLVAGMAALSSCSSVYRSGQTPDDVYYSPAPPARVQDDNYVQVNRQKDGSNYQSYDQYMDSYRDDRFLRMSMGNPYYMNSYNTYSGFDWRYNSFYDGYGYGIGSPWNNYFAWNSFYNPFNNPYYAPGLSLGYYGIGSYYGSGIYGGYYSPGYIVGIGGKGFSAAPISKPRVFNTGSYSSRPNNGRSYTPSGSYYNNTNARYNNNNGNRTNNNTYYNNNNNGGRSMYQAPTNNSNNTSTPSRSFTPSSGGSSGGSGGGGGGSVSRPGRG